MAVDIYEATADQRLRAWFLQEQAHRTRGRAETAPVPPQRTVITISRQFGAGDHTIAADLAAQLGASWQVWDQQIVDDVAHDDSIRSRMLDSMEPEARAWIDLTWWDLTKHQAMSPTKEHQHLASVLLALAQQGSKIILGRGANYVLQDALHVRLRASLSARLMDTMRRENLPRDAALKRVNQVDERRSAFVSEVFDREIDDPDSYDLVVRTDSIGHRGAVAVVLAAYRARVADPGLPGQ